MHNMVHASVKGRSLWIGFFAAGSICIFDSYRNGLPDFSKGKSIYRESSPDVYREYMVLFIKLIQKNDVIKGYYSIKTKKAPLQMAG